VEALAPGVIILDDYFNEMWPGVSEGVHRYFRELHGVLPFATGANKMLFCNASSAIPLYVDSCAPLLQRRLNTTSLVLAFSAAALPRCPSLSASARTAGGAQ
jgi:hypothetical protein